MSAVLRPVSGEGVLARHGALVLLISTPPGSDELVGALLAAHDRVAHGGGDGMALSDELGAALAASSSTVDMVAFGPSGAGLAIVVYGVAFADVATAQGQQRLAVQRPRDGVRTVLPGQLASVWAGLGDPASAGQPQRFGNLDHGVVQAAGLSLVVDDVVVPPPPPAAMPFTPQGGPGAGSPPAPVAPPAAPHPGPQAAPSSAQPPAAQPPAAPSTNGVDAGSVPPPPPAVAAAGSDAVLRPDAPATPAPADSPAAGVLAADLATGGGEPSVPDAAPAPGSGQAAPSGSAPPSGSPAPSSPAAPSGGGATAATALAGPPTDEMPLLLAKPDAPEEQALLGAPAAPRVADVDRSMPFESVSLLAPPPEAAPEQRAPLPVAQPLAPAAPDVAPAPHPAAAGAVQVMGVYCKNGHFDDPSARYCAVCGISMAQQTLIPRLGPRPPLGVLVLDDGTIFSLDKDYVIGRDPQRDQDVQNGTANPMRIDDPQGQLSRVHLRIHLEGWQVEVVDLGSANGTGVWRPGDTQWTRVPPQTRIPIRPGTQVGFGRNQLRFESHTNT